MTPLGYDYTYTLIHWQILLMLFAYKIFHIRRGASRCSFRQKGQCESRSTWNEQR